MTESRQELLAKLTQARSELAESQTRVAELEAQLSEGQADPGTPQVAEDVRNLAKFPDETPNPLRDNTALYGNSADHLLLDSESRYHRVLDSMLEGAEIIGFDWRYLYVNDASASHGRQSKEVLLHSTVIELYPGIENTEMFAVLRTCMEERTAQHFETSFVFPDGETAWFELSVQPIPEGIFILSLDITERKRSETANKRYAQRMEILHQIDLGLIQGGSIQALVESVLSHIRQIIPCQRVSVSLIDETTDEMLVFAVNLSRPSAVAKGIKVALPSGWLDGYDADRAKIIDDIRLVEDLIPAQKQLLKEGLVTFLHVLLMVQGHPLGLLALSTDTPGFFTAEYREIALEIANQLAIAIRQLNLTEELARHAAELEQKVFDRTADLTNTKERVEAILNNSADGILLVHTDLNIQQTNASFNSLFACEPDDYFGKSLASLIQADDVELVATTVQAAISDQQTRNIITRARRKDSKVFDAELSIGHIKDDGLVCTIRDISDRKRAELALHEQHEFLLQVINNLPELISVKDRAGRFQLVNSRQAEVNASTPTAMLGKTDADFNPNQDEVDFFVQKDRETLETGQTVFIPEETVFGRYYQTSKIPLKNHDGEYDRLLVVASDITEHKNAEDALRQAFEKEKDLSELKSRFVSMASHEFRTPMATILAVTDTLSAYRQRMTDEQIDLRLGKIRDQIDHLTNIMDDVLQLARLQARRADFNPVKINLDSLCRSILDEFQSPPDITHHLVYSCDDALREVYLDKKLVRQIISNLVSNAIKYSPKDATIWVNLEFKADWLTLTVRDEGIGIPEADLKHLFEPFHRAANVGTISGTGLGLTIIKESVELHGGTITVESQVEVGTTFTVTIPIPTEEGRT